MTVIDATQWNSFADRFSQQHDLWTASLHVRRNDGGEEIPIEGRPFRSITFRNGDGRAAILTFGDDPDEHLVHIIDRPAELSVLGDERGESSLVIGLEDGGGCLLELSNPFNPD